MVTQVDRLGSRRAAGFSPRGRTTARMACGTIGKPRGLKPAALRMAMCAICGVFAWPSHVASSSLPIAGVLKAGLPGEDAELVTALAGMLQKAGYEPRPIGIDELCDAGRLTRENFDLLVLASGANLPARSAAAIDRYARNGGDLIALKTPLWQQPLIDLGGRWRTREDYQLECAGQVPPHVLFRFEPTDIATWTRSPGPGDGDGMIETIDAGPGPGQRAVHVVSQRYANWDTYGPPAIEQPFAQGETLTVFSAKGGPDTTQLAIEWIEKDDSRWLAVVPLSSKWTQYVLAPPDFLFWPSVPSRSQSQFNPAAARTLRVGIAVSHTRSLPLGRHEYWIGPVGTAVRSAENEALLNVWSLPALDTLSPTYKLFDCHEVTSLLTAGEQAIIEPGKFAVPQVIRSPHPRTQGGGFDKGRAWRWIPLINARNQHGQWRGTATTLTVHADGPFKRSAWASFGIGDNDWYKNNEVLKRIGQVAEAMRRGVFILDGGTDRYTYFEKQPMRLGVRAFSTGAPPAGGVEAHVILVDLDTGQEAYRKTWPMHFPADGSIATVEESWSPSGWPVKGFRCLVEVVAGGVILDRVVHEAYVWKPKPRKHFVTVQDGAFLLDGNRWRVHGINYMPSSGIATEDGPYFEHWLGARAYDPEVIDRDLGHLKDLGFNAVSIFIDHPHIQAQNLLDLLRRLDLLGLKANLSLRPGTPMHFQWPKIREIIEYNRLWEHDCLFAFDLAWEPTFGMHEERTIWDDAWAEWIAERYGSVEAAEKDWAFPVPRDGSGKITNPGPRQIDADGPWRVMTAAYRRFLDTLLYTKYSAARRLVRSVDPQHLVSFRMSEAANPTYRWDGRISYDFPYLAGAVDFLAPEAYGRIGDWEKVKPAFFEVAYGRWAGPQIPLIWAEAGVNTWDLDRVWNSPKLLDFQGTFYMDLYRMFISSGCDGVFFWWYPGGFRCGEGSDYGIINPDGSDRPVTRVIRDYAGKLLHSPAPRPVDRWIEIDRDKHPDGISGIYDEAKEEFWKAIEAGQTPGLRTAGTGTTSMNCPLLAVGNTPCHGRNPPKYLDGVFDLVEVKNSTGQWAAVENDGQVAVTGHQPVTARVTVTNLGEATWVTESQASGQPGAVYMAVTDSQSPPTPLPSSVPRFGSIRVDNIELASEVARPTTVTVGLSAQGRTPFGEKLRVTLVPQAH